MSDPEGQMSDVLAGIRVLDFGRYIAGPYCAALLADLGADLDSLRRVKPDIILTTVTAFGAGGPWSHKHGFDGIGQVMCGSAYLSGTPEQPMRAAVAWVDCGTASLAAFGTLAALMARQKWGRGQKVEGALLRTAVAFNNPTLVEQQVIQTNRIATVDRKSVV